MSVPIVHMPLNEETKYLQYMSTNLSLSLPPPSLSLYIYIYLYICIYIKDVYGSY